MADFRQGSVLATALLVAGLTTLVAPLAGHETPAYSHDSGAAASAPDWMTNLGSCRAVSEFSLPGTHDSMARFGGDVAETQSMTLADQLASGIRVLDIRLRHINDVFAIHHGPIFQNAFFGADVLAVVSGFLTSHPGETILMRVGEEYTPVNNQLTFQEVFQNYITPYAAQIWAPEAGVTFPALRDVRGKMVFLQDFSTDPENTFGMRYKDYEIQDEYGLDDITDLYSKWEKVKDMLAAANAGYSSTRGFINYLSGSMSGLVLVFPYFVASGHSDPRTDAPRLATGKTTPGWTDWEDFPRLNCLGSLCSIFYEGTNILTSDYIAKAQLVHTGVVMADFPGEGLIQKVIGLNVLNYAPSPQANGPYEIAEGSTVFFSAVGSADVESPVLDYRWDFDGNGTWDTPFSTNQTPTRVYSDDFDGNVRVEVTDGCNSAVAESRVTVRNVAPIFQSVRIAEGRPFVLEHDAVGVLAVFSDPGHDTHTAMFDWTGAPRVTVVGAASPVFDSRVYHAAGQYAVAVTIRDDDGGEARVERSFAVLSSADAVGQLLERLGSLTANPYVRDAIAALKGNNGGKASNGALDKLVKGGNLDAVFVKLVASADSLDAARQLDPAGAVAVEQDLLADIARSMARAAIIAAENAPPTKAPARKLALAKALLAEGLTLQSSGEYRNAVHKYQDAMRAL